MFYRDYLYNVSWELPEIIARIVRTKEMIRLRNITMSVLPNCFNPLGPIPNRFQHGLGVCYLSTLVIKSNLQLSENFSNLLPVAGLLHDAGNPPFSHLSEQFLKEVTGKNGESFLEDFLSEPGSETAQILREYGCSISDVVSLVTGEWKPISSVINGSIDLDNLDNIGRYNLAVHLNAVDFNPTGIASSFRWLDKENQWVLEAKAYRNVLDWKMARQIVYKAIYGSANLTVATILHRALEIAYSQNRLPKEFFFLDDMQAVEYLLNKTGRQASYLTDMIQRWHWYSEVFSFETNAPSPWIRELISNPNWKTRKKLADMISSRFDIPMESICVYLGKGKEHRKITVPFVGFSTPQFNYDAAWDNTCDEPIYRVKVYVHPKYELYKSKICDLVSREVN